MTRKPEILFVDPDVPDLMTILLGLRPEVEAILLDAKTPAVRQMAHLSPLLPGEGSGVRDLGARQIRAVGIGETPVRDGKHLTSCARIGG
jgi:hypothetical protein